LNTFISTTSTAAACATAWKDARAYQHADACVWATGTGYNALIKACLTSASTDAAFAPTGDAANYKALLVAQVACYDTVNAVATSDCAAKAATPTGGDDGEDDGEDSSSLLTFSAMLLLVLSALLF